MLCMFSSAQSNLEKVLKSGEIVVNGLSFLISNKAASKSSNAKVVEGICVKNKLLDKISFSLVGKDEEGTAVKKELVIQKDGKECVFELPKGIYTYEVVLANKEIYKKDEYKFYEELTITVKEE